MLVGVLALQGGFALHLAALRKLGVEAVEVRDAATLAEVRGLVIPGGESTAIALGLRRAGLLPTLRSVHERGGPVLVTCAGLILAASPELSWLDIDVRRNADGPQRNSAVAQADDQGDELVFIRAPRIVRTGPGVEVLAQYEGRPVLVRERNVVGATFHPELSSDSTLHARLFAAS